MATRVEGEESGACAATNIFLRDFQSAPTPIAPHNGFHDDESSDLGLRYRNEQAEQ